jgi:hypothetical protein
MDKKNSAPGVPAQVPNFATALPSAVAIKELGDGQTVSGEKSGRGRPLDLSIGEGRAL